MLPKLTKIYKIKDITRRQEALLDHARALNIPLVQSQKGDGGVDFDKLTVLIFDEENARLKIYKKNLFLAVAGATVFIILALGIFLFQSLTAALQ